VSTRTRTRSRAVRVPRTVAADRVAEQAVERLKRLVTSESLRMASELAAVGVSGDRVAVLIATALRATADGMDP
jgi:hypothetical protein